MFLWGGGGGASSQDLFDDAVERSKVDPYEMEWIEKTLGPRCLQFLTERVNCVGLTEPKN